MATAISLPIRIPRKNALKIDDKFWVENGEKLERVFGIYVQFYVSNPMTDTELAQAELQ